MLQLCKIGANIDWNYKYHSKLTQKLSTVRLFVDSDNNIYLSELYPYHDNNANVNLVGNSFMKLIANVRHCG